jgi:hypothetical protein
MIRVILTINAKEKEEFSRLFSDHFINRRIIRVETEQPGTRGSHDMQGDPAKTHDFWMHEKFLWICETKIL